MARSIRVFKEPSQIQFAVQKLETKVAMLSEAKRGDTFLREGAICMRVDNSVNVIREDLPLIEYASVAQAIRNKIWVCNLQTGRVWASEDCPVEWIKVCVTVEGE